MFCADYANLFGRPYTVLRYGIPFGPRMRSDLVVAAFLERALRGEPLRIDGDGAQERSFVYVEDLAAAHVLALAPVAKNRTYNLEANEPISIRQLAETVGELVGDTEVTFGPSRPGRLPRQAREQRAGAHRARLGAAVRLRGGPRNARSSGTASNDRTPAPATTVPSPVDGDGARGGSRWSRRTTKSRWSRPCSTSCTRSSTSSWWSTTARPTAPAREIEAWLPGHDRCQLLVPRREPGDVGGVHPRAHELRDRLDGGELTPDDLVFTVDADGQHDLAVLDELVEMTIDRATSTRTSRGATSRTTGRTSASATGC